MTALPGATQAPGSARAVFGDDTEAPPLHLGGERVTERSSRPTPGKEDGAAIGIFLQPMRLVKPTLHRQFAFAFVLIIAQSDQIDLLFKQRFLPDFGKLGKSARRGAAYSAASSRREASANQGSTLTPGANQATVVRDLRGEIETRSSGLPFFCSAKYSAAARYDGSAGIFQSTRRADVKSPSGA